MVSELTGRFTEVEGLRIAYESFGSGDPPVLLVHSGFGDRSYYNQVASRLSTRHRVVTLDLRGHGLSDTPSAVTIEDFVTDVIAVADATGVSGAVLCGHSMAGAVALLVALARPDLAGAVVMLDATVLSGTARAQTEQNLLPALATDGWRDALQGFFGATIDRNDPPEVADRVMADLEKARPEIARSFFDSLYGPAHPDRERRIAQAIQELPCPVMYVHARFPIDLDRLRELRPDVTVTQIDGVGHYVMLSAPEWLSAVLEEFTQRCSS